MHPLPHLNWRILKVIEVKHIQSARDSPLITSLLTLEGGMEEEGGQFALRTRIPRSASGDEFCHPRVVDEPVEVIAGAELRLAARLVGYITESTLIRGHF